MSKVECPRCRQQIHPRASRCQHCHADFTEVERAAIQSGHGSQKVLLGMLALIIAAGVFVSAGSNGNSSDGPARAPAYDTSPPEVGTDARSVSAGAVDPVTACAQRGVAYFKEIGSYPTLQSAPDAGRAADDVALERCRRTTTAF